MRSVQWPHPSKELPSRRTTSGVPSAWRPSSSSFGVRRASAEDADEILACLRDAFAPFRGSYTRTAYRNTVLSRTSLALRMATMIVLVAVDAEGSVVGTIAWQVQSRKRGHLRGMAVRPRWQGMGVANELLDTTERELRRLRCTCVTLGTTSPLRRAMRFYERHGFRRTGRVSDFFGIPLYEYAKRYRGAKTSRQRRNGRPPSRSPGRHPGARVKLRSSSRSDRSDRS